MVIITKFEIITNSFKKNYEQVIEFIKFFLRCFFALFFQFIQFKNFILFIVTITTILNYYFFTNLF